MMIDFFETLLFVIAIIWIITLVIRKVNKKWDKELPQETFRLVTKIDTSSGPSLEDGPNEKNKFILNKEYIGFYLTNNKQKFFVPEEGKNKIKLLPPLINGKSPFYVCQHHYHLSKPYFCPRKSINGKWTGYCPVCEYYINSNDVNFKPKVKYYYNIMVHDDTQSTFRGPYVWICNYPTHNQISSLITQDIEDQAELFNLTKSYCIVFNYNIKQKPFPVLDHIRITSKPYELTDSDLLKIQYQCDLEKYIENNVSSLEKLQSLIPKVANEAHVCCFCQKVFHNSKEKRYCSKKCYQDHFLIKNKDYYGCPRCGERLTAQINGLYSFSCGYQASCGHVNQKCKYFPDCICSSEQKYCVCTQKSPIINE